jgi:hypothetical protein
MAFQGIMPEQGKVDELLEIDGAKLVGTKIKAPFSPAPEVYYETYCQPKCALFDDFPISL